MKKVVIFFLLVIGLVIYCPEVNALELNSSEIGNSSYIIGEYLFTRKANDSYTGQLTTQYIMLSAMSIKECALKDMTIYYKNPRGIWYDALTGNQVSPPAKFDINYIDLVSTEGNSVLNYEPQDFVVFDSHSISSASYVIGTHVFTRNSNENYKGQLTTQYIMLASKTINQNNLANMIIYYKNPRGVWYDALTGKTVNVPDSFKVEYVDTVKVLNTFTDINKCNISLSSNSFTYDGNAKKPSVIVTYNGNVLNENVDYTLSYENNINSGEALVIVTGKGNFSNSKRLTYNIVSQTLSIPTSSYCNSLIYNGNSQTLTKEAPSNVIFKNNIGINADSYYVTSSLTDKTNYKWSDETVSDKTFSCSIGKKDMMVKANNQTITYGNSIKTGVNYVTLSGNVTGHILSSIVLTPSTTNPTTSGKITPSTVIIKDSNGNIVTGNYNILYKMGTLVIKPPTEVIIDNFDNYQSTVKMEDLSAYHIKYPTFSNVNTEVEDKGMLASFKTVQGDGWAQRYQFISDVKSKFSLFSDFSDQYSVRIWVAEENMKRFGIGLYLYNDVSEFYVDPSKIKLIDYRGELVTRNDNYTGFEFYENTHVLLPEGFHGWVNFPLNAIKDSLGKFPNLKNISKIILDVRPEEPKTNTFYILDNLVISKNTKANKFNNTYEINYRNDLVGLKYNNWYDFWYSAAGNNGNVYNTANILNGTENKFHYWGKPALGYYKSSDTGVIRQHLQQLADAKIDFIFIDLTNLAPKYYEPYVGTMMEQYYENWIWTYQVTISNTAILDTMNEMKKEGKKIPHVVFWAGSFNKFGTYNDEGNQYVMNRLYNEYINNSKYKDLFLYYDGKPLVIGTNRIPLSRLETNITYRYMWALQNNQSDIHNGEWTNRVLPGSGIYGTDSNGVMEEMPINVAYSAYYMSLGATHGASDGRYYHSFDSTTPVVIGREGGKTFYTSWQKVFENHPKIAMISSWNEWGAQRVNDANALCQDKCFTDQYNTEYSEDIEPMIGGHGEQYYQWLIQYVNDYKSHNSCPRLVASGY